MSRENRSQIKAGVILSYLNIGIGNIIPLFYTPLMLSLLGQNEYGLYKIASSMTSYLSLMALGIGSAVTRYMIKAREEGGKEAEELTFGLFHVIFQGIAIMTCIVGAVIVLKLDVFYDASLTASQLARMKILVALMVLNMAVGFSATSYNAAVITHECFVFVQGINVLSTIGLPILNIVFLVLGSGTIGMAFVALAVNICIRVAYVIYVKKKLQLKPCYQKMPQGYIFDILKFSFWILVGNLAGQLYNATDTVIIGAIPNLATVGAAIYNVGTTFSNMMFSLAQVVPTLFSPKANRMVFAGATDRQLSDLVIKVGRLQAYIVALVAFGFIAFGQPFIQWYAGEEYRQSYWVAVIIMIPNCIPLVQSVAHSVMQAKNLHRFRAILYLIIAIVNVVATALLIKPFGLIGAALPTGIAFIIGHGIILNIYYWKRVGIDIPRFWKKILPIFITAAGLSIVTISVSYQVDFYNISIMIGGIVIYTVLYFVAVWFWVADCSEKELIKNVIMRSINDIKTKLK